MSQNQPSQHRLIHSREWKISVLAACLLIAVLICSFAILYHNLSKIVQSSEEMTREQGASIAQETSNLLSNYSKLSDILSANSNVLEFSNLAIDVSEDEFVQKGFLLQKNLISLVNIYGEDINTLAVYFPSNQSIVTMARYLSSDSSYRFFSDYPEISPEKLDALPAGSVSSPIYIQENSHHWIIRKSQIHGSSYVYILVEFNLESFIEKITHTTDDSMVLIGTNDTLLYSSSEDITEQIYHEFLSEATTHRRITTVDNTFYAHCVPTRIKEVQIISGISSSRFQRIQSMFGLVILVTAITVLLGIGTLLGHLRKNVFSPLEHLINTSRRNGQETSQIIQSIAVDLQTLENNHSVLQKERDYLVPMSVGLTMNRMKEVSETQAVTYAQSCLLLSKIPQGSGFAMFALVCVEDPLFSNLQSPTSSRLGPLHYFLHNVLQDLLFTDFPGVIAPVGFNRFIVLVSCPEKKAVLDISNARKQLISFYADSFSVRLSATDVVWGCNSQNFVESISLLFRDMLFLNSGNVPGSAPSGISSTSFSTHCNQIRTLIHSLTPQNIESISKKLDQVFLEALPPNIKNIRLVKNRMNAITAIIISSIEEQLSANHEFVEQLNFEGRLYDVVSITEYQKAVKEILKEVIQYKEAVDQTLFISSRMEDIRQYALANYCENSISVASIAQEFDISVSYLSRTFKEAYNMNLLEYIQRLRVDTAKKLLLNDSVQNVAQAVGFWDAQGLTRAFKKFEGISPGDYKRLAEKEKSWL